MTDLVFHGLDLLGWNEHEGGQFELVAEGDDATWGNPKEIDVWVTSMLQDGALVYTQGYENRDMFLRIRVIGLDAAGLQAGEDALAQACGRRTTLEWTPPIDGAATTVFQVETAHLDHVYDDLTEQLRTTRTYGLRLTALPFTRSVDKVTLVAEPDGVAYTQTVVSEATSTTNWTASHTLSLVSAQAVRSTKSFPLASETYDLWLEYGGGFTVPGGEEYVRVKYGSTTTGDLTLTVDGVDYQPVVISAGHAWFAVPAGTYTTVRFNIHHVGVTSSGGRPISSTSLTVWSIYTTSTAGFGSRKELARTFSDIPGSVRAPGDLTISHPSDGLGDVIAYIYPTTMGDYSPPLQQWRTNGAAQTADTTAVSGTKEALNGGTPATWSVSPTALPPGGYHFVARLKHTTTAGTYTVTYTITTGGKTVTRTAKVTIDAIDTWQVIHIVTDQLPLKRVIEGADFSDGVSGNTTLTLAGPANLLLDTAWIFYANELDTPTALIRVEAGDETSVVYHIADTELPEDMVYVGAFSAREKLKAADTPHMVPPGVNIYLVTTDVEDAEVMFEGFPHWNTHAGR